MPGAPHGSTQAAEVTFGDFWSLFGDSWGALGEPGGGIRNPQKGFKMLPQTLLEVPLVAKRWPEQPEQELGRQKAIFEGFGHSSHRDVRPYKDT